MIYKINIINFPKKVVNTIFTTKLLHAIYDLYNFKYTKLDVFTYEHFENKSPILLNYFLNLKKSIKKSIKKTIKTQSIKLSKSIKLSNSIKLSKSIKTSKSINLSNSIKASKTIKKTIKKYKSIYKSIKL